MARWPGGVALSEAEAARVWASAGEFSWAHAGGVLLKVIVTPARVAELAGILREIAGARSWVGAGGNVAWVSLPSADAAKIFGEKCRARHWPALTLRGEAALWPGGHAHSEVAVAVKRALDPQNRFPSLDD